MTEITIVATANAAWFEHNTHAIVALGIEGESPVELNGKKLYVKLNEVEYNSDVIEGVLVKAEKVDEILDLPSGKLIHTVMLPFKSSFLPKTGYVPLRWSITYAGDGGLSAEIASIALD